MRSLDQVVEQSARSLAQRTSRRSLLGLLGRLLTGAAVLPLLPIERGGRAHANEAHPGPDSAESCDYWKYCAIDGFLCACCGGTSTACPPGTDPQTAPSNHSATAMFTDDVLPDGATLYAELALRRLAAAALAPE